MDEIFYKVKICEKTTVYFIELLYRTLLGKKKFTVK